MGVTKAQRERWRGAIRKSVRESLAQTMASAQVERIPSSRMRKAIARSADLETKITGTESESARVEKIKAIQTIALAEAQKDNARIVNSDSAMIYQITQRMQSMRKNEGIVINLDFFSNMDDTKAELRYAVRSRFKSGQFTMEIHRAENKLKIWRNF